MSSKILHVIALAECIMFVGSQTLMWCHLNFNIFFDPGTTFLSENLILNLSMNLTLLITYPVNQREMINLIPWSLNLTYTVNLSHKSVWLIGVDVDPRTSCTTFYITKWQLSFQFWFKWNKSEINEIKTIWFPCHVHTHSPFTKLKSLAAVKVWWLGL